MGEGKRTSPPLARVWFEERSRHTVPMPHDRIATAIPAVYFEMSAALLLWQQGVGLSTNGMSLCWCWPTSPRRTHGPCPCGGREPRVVPLPHLQQLAAIRVGRADPGELVADDVCEHGSRSCELWASNGGMRSVGAAMQCRARGIETPRRTRIVCARIPEFKDGLLQSSRFLTGPHRVIERTEKLQSKLDLSEPVQDIAIRANCVFIALLGVDDLLTLRGDAFRGIDRIGFTSITAGGTRRGLCFRHLLLADELHPFAERNAAIYLKMIEECHNLLR